MVIRNIGCSSEAHRDNPTKRLLGLETTTLLVGSAGSGEVREDREPVRKPGVQRARADHRSTRKTAALNS